MASGDEEDVMGRTDCERTRELLPWFARGSLERDEASRVAAHVEGCARCRLELADTCRILWATGQHLPADLLADYGSGLDLGEWPRDLVEEHLAHCGGCREDLGLGELAEPPPRNSTESFSPPSVPNRSITTRSRWRPLALAASILGATAVGWLVGGTGVKKLQPTFGHVELLELSPESFRERAVSAPLPELHGIGATTLVLTTDRVSDTARFRLRIFDARGRTVGGIDDVSRNSEGLFVVQLGAESLPEGELRFELEQSSGASWSAFESYRLVRRR